MAKIYVSEKVLVLSLEKNYAEAIAFGDVFIVHADEFEDTIHKLEQELNDCRPKLLVVGIDEFGKPIKTKTI